MSPAKSGGSSLGDLSKKLSLGDSLTQDATGVNQGEAEVAINGRITWERGTSALQTQSIIEFFQTANASTGFHELAHHMLRVMVDLAQLDGASEGLKADVETVLKNAGITREQWENDAAAREKAHEFFARSFETYLAEGKAPSAELEGAFKRIRQWMIEVYRDVVQALGIELNDEMRDVFDRLLATPEELNERTTVGELAVEHEAAAAEMERLKAEARAEAENAQRARQEADDAVEGWLRERQDYEDRKATWGYIQELAKAIRDNGGLRVADLVRELGEELAKDLQKKWPGLFRNTTKGPQLELDVLAQQLQTMGIDLDVGGLVQWLQNTVNETPKRPEATLRADAETLDALMFRLGPEGVRDYLTERKRFLRKEAEGTQDAAALRRIYAELRDIDRIQAAQANAAGRLDLDRARFDLERTKFQSEEAYRQAMMNQKNLGAFTKADELYWGELSRNKEAAMKSLEEIQGQLLRADTNEQAQLLRQRDELRAFIAECQAAQDALYNRSYGIAPQQGQTPQGQAPQQPTTGTLGDTGNIANDMVPGARMTSGFGKRGDGSHDAEDWAAPEGTPILVPDLGIQMRVAQVGTDPTARIGNFVRLEGTLPSGDKVAITVGHMRNGSLRFKGGETVNPEAIIGEVGNTGRTASGKNQPSLWFEGKKGGYHAHVKTEINGKVVVPKTFYQLARAQSKGMNTPSVESTLAKYGTLDLRPGYQGGGTPVAAVSQGVPTAPVSADVPVSGEAEARTLTPAEYAEILQAAQAGKYGDKIRTEADVARMLEAQGVRVAER